LARIQRLRVPLLVAAGYYLGAQIGFALTYQPRPISPLWLPNAILMSALLLSPVRSWWVILAAAFPAHVATQIGAGVPWRMLISWFISNSSEALIGATFLIRLAKRPVHLDRLPDIGVFLLVAIVAALSSSFLDAAFVTLNDWGEGTYWELWSHRSLSNTLSTLLVVPVVLAWSRAGVRSVLAAPLRRNAEAAVLTVVLFAVSALVFSRVQPGPQALAALLYAPLPFLFWAAVRFGPRGASTSVLAVALIAIWSSVNGRGPFASASVEQNALSLQLLFVIMSVTLLALAAVIEERRHAQESARQKSEQLQLALESVRMSTWEWPLASAEQLESSDSFDDQSSGVSLSRFLQTVYPVDREIVEGAIRNAVDQRGSYEKEFRVLREDGTVAWMIGRGKVLHDENGRPVRLIGIHADVSERKAAEALTNEENRILELIATAAPLTDVLRQLVQLIESEAGGVKCSVMLLDPDGVHVRVGAAPSLPESYLAAIDGATIGPKAGSCGTAMHRGRAVMTTDIATDALWVDYRDVALQHDLRACWSTPIVSQSGQVLGAFAMYYSEPRGPGQRELRLIEFATQLATIALERRRAEAESEQQRSDLRHLARVAALGGLSGALAHELSQPLTAILTNTHAAQRLMQSPNPDLPELREILKDIEASDLRAASLIDHLRGMLRKGQRELAPLDLNRVASETLQLARSDLANREVHVSLHLAPLPPVLGDPVQLEQVLLNLIMNACESMSAVTTSRRRLTIATSGADDGQVRLSVTDTGTGIPQELRRRMFEPFVTSKERGLGLGLSISRSIVVAHGGHLWFENNPDHGATFHLTLPAASEVSDA
jgi:signal transduction histidine kinase/integral membrane sensor domain MASE1